MYNPNSAAERIMIKNIEEAFFDSKWGEELTPDKLIEIQNTIANDINDPAMNVYYMDDLNTIFEGIKPLDLLKKFDYFDTDAEYFRFNYDDKIEPIWDIYTSDVIDWQEIAIYCLDHNESFGLSAVADVLRDIYGTEAETC